MATRRPPASTSQEVDALRTPLRNPAAPAPRPAQSRSDSAEAMLDAMTLQDLLDLRARIDARLPARSLMDINLERELVLQVLALQQMQSAVINDEYTPANQRAQVANSLSTALSNLVKVQNDTHTSERLKTIETVLIEVVKTLPEAQANQFLALYEQALDRL